ncbi:MAG TPA: hypothetical protein VFF68_04325 [Anaerolineaceae bacterium]|nr:hypothetical protein [Anaerolineaceae bacterium]
MFNLQQFVIPLVVFLLFLLTILFTVLAVRRNRDLVTRAQRDAQYRAAQQEITRGQARDDGFTPGS